MSSTNKTTNLELSQFLGSDSPKWLTDYNADMEKIDAGYQTVKAQADATNLIVSGHTSSISTLQETVASQGTAITGLRTDVNGNSGSINTINELLGNGEPTTTNKTIIGAINELNSNVGDISTNLNGKFIINQPEVNYTYTGVSGNTFETAIIAALSDFYNNVVIALADDKRVRIRSVKIGDFTYLPASEYYYAKNAASVSVELIRNSVTSAGLNIRDILASNTAVTRFLSFSINSSAAVTIADMSADVFTNNIIITYEEYLVL